MSELHERIEKYENLIQDIYDICLCERFETVGFDYHEKHPRRSENNKGSRPKTPRDLIEARLGFTWVYEKPKGVCSSKKVIHMTKNIMEITNGHTDFKTTLTRERISNV